MAQRSGKVSAALSPLGPACSPGNRGGRGGGGARPREPLPLLWAGGMEDGGAGGHLLLDTLHLQSWLHFRTKRGILALVEGLCGVGALALGVPPRVRSREGGQI